jgi:hypothetical protein
MIADEVQERLVADVVASAPQGVPVAARLMLRDETQHIAMLGNGLRVQLLVAGRDDDADLLDARAEDLPNEDGEDGPANAIAIHERLER